METEILKEALDLARPKNDLAAAVVERSPGRFKVKAVAEALGVSRSNRFERAQQRTKARGPIARPRTVLASNPQWCSDHLELHARNGEVVRVLFATDTRYL